MEKKKIKDIGLVFTGSTPSKKNDSFYASNDIPFIKPSDLSNNITTLSTAENFISENARKVARIIPPNSVLCTCIGIIGKVGINEVEATCNQQINYIIPNKNNVAEFIGYSLLSIRDELEEVGKDSPIVPIINKSTFENFEIPYYTKEKQIEIVNVLNNISKAISLSKKQLLTLDELVKSRFIEMFGKYFEDKSRLVKVSTLASATIGLTYKPENVSENGTIVLRSGNIQNAELYLEKDIVRVSNVKIKEDKYVRENDILMCSRNGSAKLVGKCCRIPKLDEPMTYGAFMTVIRSIYPYFLNGFFNSTYFTQQLTGTQTASVNQITTGMLNNYDVICPTKDEENEFAKFVKLIDKSKFIVQQQIKDLEELLDSKMDEYFR